MNQFSVRFFRNSYPVQCYDLKVNRNLYLPVFSMNLFADEALLYEQFCKNKSVSVIARPHIKFLSQDPFSINLLHFLYPSSFCYVFFLSPSGIIILLRTKLLPFILYQNNIPMFFISFLVQKTCSIFFNSFCTVVFFQTYCF